MPSGRHTELDLLLVCCVDGVASGRMAAFGGCRACRSLRFPHRTNKAEALARQGFDEALFPTGIADRAPGGIQAGCQCLIGDATPVPGMALMRSSLLTTRSRVADQAIEQVEYLWRDGDDVLSAMQLAPGQYRMRILRTNSASCIPTMASDRRGSSIGCNAKNKPSVRKM